MLPPLNNCGYILLMSFYISLTVHLGIILVNNQLDTLFSMYRVRHKSINTPLSHERLVGGLQDGGHGTHVTHFVQLYPQPLHTASQVRTTCRSWDEGVLTDISLTGVLINLCLTLYLFISLVYMF